MAISETLEAMKEKKRGFRNNDWSGNREFRLEEVLYHEIRTLNNSDILAFCNKAYGAGFDIEYADLREEWKAEEQTEEEMRESLSFAFCENAADHLREAEDWIRSKFEQKELYAVWLTSEESVLKRYASGKNTVVSEYRIPEDALIVSDLGIDGALFVTARNPENLLKSEESL